MAMTFPHGRPKVVTESMFLAGWQTWFDRFGPPGATAARDTMPISASHKALGVRLGQGHRFSLDVLARMLVASRDTKQASKAFRTDNAHVLDTAGVVFAVPNRKDGVKGVRLTAEGRRLLTKVTPDDLAAIDALLGADVEDAAKGELLDVADLDLGLSAVSMPAQTPPPRPQPAPTATMTLTAIAAFLVDQIEHDPFQARYRGAAHGGLVAGWPSRHAAYFWPNPSVGVAAVVARLHSLIARAGALMASVVHGPSPWTPVQCGEAVDLANEIFAWGGVPQAPAKVTATNVRAVFESVVAGKRVKPAPMNSGWTKVAALASEALVASSQVPIWDSRVAHSLIGRLDAWFSAAGLTEVPHAVSDVGHVPGRGGTRLGARYQLAWPRGYASWPAQFAGGALVREMRDVLNAGAIRPAGGAAWTVRDVEMVLFMDGY